MQIAKQHLGKRARYYHSQMDMDLLESGHEYLKLPETYVIFICDFDPFGLEKYCYTFESRCVQEVSLTMGDYSRSIFLSTAGKDAEKIPKELKAFLKFVKEDTPENNTQTEDVYVGSLQRSIRRLKENRELERSFMTWDEVRQMSREEGFAAGIVQGRSEGIIQGRSEGIIQGRSEGIVQGRSEGISKDRQDVILEHLSTLGEIPEELRTRITSETNIDVLKAMTTALFSAGSVSEFETLISNLS